MNTLMLRMPVQDLATRVRSGEIQVGEVLEACEKAINESAQLNAVVHVDIGSLRSTSAPASSGTLAGVPVVVKDNIATLQMPTSCGSAILRDYVSPFEATAVARLKAAGALIVAKSNMDEFGMGSSTEWSVYGATRNPHDAGRVAGGSSGGSAAAVAAGIARVALGSETGGSVRQPAAFCGIVGVKPTYGRVSRHGLVAFASSLDNIGVFGATVREAAAVLEVIAGHDPLDSTSAPVEVPEMLPSIQNGEKPLEGIRVGLPREYFPPQLDSGIANLVQRTASTLRDLGAKVDDVSLPHTPYAIPTYYIIAPAEASSNLARFDGVRYGVRAHERDVNEMYEATRSLGFGPEVTRRILLGTYVLSAGYRDAYYKRAQQVRRLIARDFQQVFESGVDVLLTPTTPTTAFALGSRANAADPYEMYMSDIFTVTANLAGLPALSLPVGRVDGLPVGAQLLGPAFCEPRLIRVAAALEGALGEAAHT